MGNYKDFCPTCHSIVYDCTCDLAGKLPTQPTVEERVTDDWIVREIEINQNHIKQWAPDDTEHLAELNVALKELQSLRASDKKKDEALRFYKNSENWHEGKPGNWIAEPNGGSFQLDGGRRATNALRRAPDKEKDELKNFAIKVATALIIKDDDHAQFRIDLQNKAREILKATNALKEDGDTP